MPADAIVDDAYNIIVADYHNNRVQRYTFGSLIGTTIAGNTTASISPSQLSLPGRVILDSNKNMYISDYANHRIQFWPKDASVGRTVAGTSGNNNKEITLRIQSILMLGISGTSNTQLDLPYGVGLSTTSNAFYVVDYGNHRIMSYVLGNSSGTLMLGGQGPGTNTTQLYNPTAIYVDSITNSLAIANWGAHNIVRCQVGRNFWTLVAGNANGTACSASTCFNNPSDVTFDPMGNMYVADTNNHRIQFFSPGQLNGTTIAGTSGAAGNSPIKLNFPYSMKLDNQLNLYVADAYNHRIQKFLRY